MAFLSLLIASSALAAWNRATGPDRLPEAPYIAGQMMIATDEDNAFLVGLFENSVPIGAGGTVTYPLLPICLAATQKLIFNGYAAVAPWTCETDNGGTGCAPGGTCAAQIAAPFSPAFQLLSGTTTNNATNQITGVSTKFTTEVKVGDRMRVSSDLTKNGVVQSVFDDTHLVTSSPLGNGTSQFLAVNKSPMAAAAITYTYCGGQGGEMYTNANASTTVEVCELSSPNCTASVLCTPSYSLVVGDVIRFSSNNFSTRHRVLSISDANHNITVTPAAGNNTGNQQIQVERLGSTSLSNGDWMAGATFTNRDPQNPNSSGFNEMVPDLYYSAGHKQFLARTMHLTERGDTPELFFVRIGNGPFPYSPQVAGDQLASSTVPGIIRWYGSSQDTVVQLATMYVRALETVANASHGGGIYLATVPIGGTVEQVMLQVTSAGIKVGCEDGSATCGATPIGIQFLGASDSNNFVTLRGVAAPAGTSAVATIEELTGTVCTTNASSACLAGGYGDVTSVGTCAGGACFSTGVAGHQLSSDDELLMMVDVNNDDTTRGLILRHNNSATDLITLREDGQIIIAAGDGKFRGLDPGGSGFTGSWRSGTITADRVWDGPNASGTVQLGPLTGDGTTTAAGALTLASVVAAGSCTSCDLTIDAKGRVTAKASGAGVSGTIDVEEDNASVDAAVTNLDFTEPDAVLVTSSPAGEANVAMNKYTLLGGRSGGQTVKGGTASGNSLTLESTAHATKGTIILTDPLILWNDADGITAPATWSPTFTISTNAAATGINLSPAITDSDATAKGISMLATAAAVIHNAAGVDSFYLVNDSSTHSATTTNPLGNIVAVEAFQTISNSTASNQTLSNLYGVEFTPVISTSSTGNITNSSQAGLSFWPTYNCGAGSTCTVTNGYGVRMQLPINSGAGTAQYTNIYGIDVPALVGTTSATALRSAIAAATGAYTIRGTGTAQSALAGKMIAGSNTTPSLDLEAAAGFGTRKADNSTTCTSCTSADIDATNKSFIKITGAAASARTLHGLGGGVNGQRLTLYNSDTKDLTISNDSATEGTAGNRILTLGDTCTMLGTGYVDLAYDSTASRWVVVGCTPPVQSGFSVGTAADQLLGTLWLGPTHSCGSGTEAPCFAPMMPGNYSRIDCHVTAVAAALCTHVFTLKTGACTSATGSATALVCGILANATCTGAGAPASCCTGAGAGTCNTSACSFTVAPVAVAAGDCGEVAVISAGSGCGAAPTKSAYCTTR